MRTLLSCLEQRIRLVPNEVCFLAAADMTDHDAEGNPLQDTQPDAPAAESSAAKKKKKKSKVLPNTRDGPQAQKLIALAF